MQMLTDGTLDLLLLLPLFLPFHHILFLAVMQCPAVPPKRAEREGGRDEISDRCVEIWESDGCHFGWGRNEVWRKGEGD